MERDGLVWKTSPGAWEVEPPGVASGPCSTTVMSVQPRSTSSSARLAPTMPAPMISTRGLLMIGYSCCWSRDARTSAEDDGAGPVAEHPSLTVPAHGAGQRQRLGVATHGGQRVGVEGVVHPDDLLLDDRPLVELRGDVVGSGPDHLDPARVRLVVGPGPLESGQERVVDVDGPA